MVLADLFWYAACWILGGFTCVSIYQARLQSLALAKIKEDLRQKKIDALYRGTKYSDID